MPKALRSVLAVLAGFLVIGVLAFGTGRIFQAMSPAQFHASGAPTTTAMMLVQLLYVGVYATFGCWLSGYLAPNRPMAHALAVGVLGLALNIPSAIMLRGSHPIWYLATGIVTTVLWAWLGGRIAERRGTTTRGAMAAAA